MQEVLALLALLAAGAAVVGAVRPAAVLPARWKPGRLKATGGYGLVAVAALFALGSTFSPEERARLAKERIEREAVAEARAEVAREAPRADAERRAAQRAEEAASARAAEALRKVERSSTHVERVERAGPFVTVWLKPIESFTDKGWFDRLSFVLGDVWPAVRDAMPDAEGVRVIAQADFAGERGIAVQLAAPMAEVRHIRFAEQVGPALLNVAEIEKLRLGMRDEVTAFCGDPALRREAERFCQAAVARLRAS
ncbi:hypothetical protein [Azospirillum sp. Sh1]|uniref:hypothetical protein n=1 Tax=Azospirillum sp. Sh1 TaxID=2607285 RepID=UPI0011EF9017|nr:hypothetical protein [Azospirillum sp. Sh1]KAA0571102.1 hypothetical protein FZ029_28010 [Azospirillum sp. Sh1]